MCNLRVRVLVGLCLILWAAGCSSNRLTHSNVGSQDASPPATQDVPSPGDARERLIQAAAELKIETPDPAATHAQVILLADSLGGYVVGSTADETEIRIPALRFMEAVAAVESLGKLLERRVTGEDVTETYLDLRLRIENAEQTRARYLGLLETSRDLDETLRLEVELRRITLEIERLKGQLESLSHRLKFASIRMRTRMPSRQTGVVVKLVSSVGDAAKWLFAIP